MKRTDLVLHIRAALIRRFGFYPGCFPSVCLVDADWIEQWRGWPGGPTGR